jgi:hypothetical protein
MTFYEVPIFAEQFNRLAVFMKQKSLSPCSQKLALRPYPRPVQSTSTLRMPLFNTHSFEYYSHIYSYKF